MEDYNEMMLQIGYITFFVATFPLAPLMGLINNVVEIRVDAFKYLFGQRRPFYKGAQDIGAWGGIMGVMSIVAVFTNLFIIVYITPMCNNLGEWGRNFFGDPSQPLDYATRHRSKFGNPDNSAFAFKTIIFFGLEHAILLTKICLHMLIPDVTPETLDKMRAEKARAERKEGVQEEGIWNRLKDDATAIRDILKEQGKMPAPQIGTQDKLQSASERSSLLKRGSMMLMQKPKSDPEVQEGQQRYQGQCMDNLPFGQLYDQSRHGGRRKSVIERLQANNPMHDIVDNPVSGGED